MYTPELNRSYSVCKYMARSQVSNDLIQTIVTNMHLQWKTVYRILVDWLYVYTYVYIFIMKGNWSNKIQTIYVYEVEVNSHSIRNSERFHSLLGLSNYFSSETAFNFELYVLCFLYCRHTPSCQYTTSQLQYTTASKQTY